MFDFKSNTVFYQVIGVFLSFLVYFIAYEDYLILGVPLVVGLLGLLFLKLDYVYYLLFILTPLSINVDDVGLGFGLSLPTEPLLFLLTAVLMLKFLTSWESFFVLLKHPFSVLIIAYLGWVLMCTAFSTMPIVSLKFFISKLVYVLCFYFLGLLVFQEHPFPKIKKTLWFYFVPMLGVIIYTLYRHTLNAYDEKAAHWVMQPFFKDHTIYGAILAFLAPFCVLVTFKRQKNFNMYVVFMFILSVFTIGLIFSYTRAAWVSLVGALGLYGLLYFRVKWYALASILSVFLLLFVLNWEQLMLRLEKNKQDSSDDLVEHVQSISNIASDASNLERLNRWNCAIKMFQSKPIFGYGPGTYMFQYAPFQSSGDLTIISTNFGDGGNAHSEYLGPLSEMGLLGFLFMLAIVIFTSYYAIVNYYYYDTDKRKYILVLFLGFSTYAAHGILNNYLDTDKASVLFWTTISFIVALDLKRKHSLASFS